MTNKSQIASGPNVLEGTPTSVSKTATKLLQNVKVTIKASTKVGETAKLPDGRTELTLSSGEKVITDLYLPTVGLQPNSSYVPAGLVNGNGFVVVDEFLRVKGAAGVWAVGDVSAIQRPQYTNTETQSAQVAKNIGLVLKGAQPVKYKVTEKGESSNPFRSLSLVLTLVKICLLFLLAGRRGLDIWGI